MEYLQTVQAPAIILRDQRKNTRHQVSQLLVITARGTGRVINISLEGLSFGCLYPHNFPLEMKVDILGANGTFIQGVCVETCWENNYSPMQRSDNFEKITGLRFINLSHEQSTDLADIIEQIDSAELTTVS